ncbi:unnamed protein product, partial [Chrysoparadoxa australica]
MLLEERHSRSVASSAAISSMQPQGAAAAPQEAFEQLECQVKDFRDQMESQIGRSAELQRQLKKQEDDTRELQGQIAEKDKVLQGNTKEICTQLDGMRESL